MTEQDAGMLLGPRPRSLHQWSPRLVLPASRGWQTFGMDDEVQALVAEQVAYYRTHAPDYDDAYLGKDWDRCVQELPIAGDVLELACGTGHWTPLLAARARSVTAVDTHHPQPDKLDRRRAPAVIGSSPPKAAGSKALPAGGAVCP